MLNRILVPLDPSPFANAAVSYACELASFHGAEITGLLIIDSPGIHQSVTPFSPGSAHLAERAELRLEAEAHVTLREIEQRFAVSCDAAGVSHRFQELQGDPVETISEVSAYYDLLVIGLRTHFHFQTSSSPGESLSKLLGHLSTPVLAVPEVYRPFGSNLDAVLAFDGSPASIRSMRQFAQNSAIRDTDLVILTSNSEMAVAQEIAKPAEEYLRASGYNNIRVDWTPEEIRDAIDARYINSAEIIVVGMHSKRGLLSFHVGSLTDHLVQDATVPVYIGQ